MDSAVSKYFLAIVPPSPIYEELSGMKEHMRDKYGSSAALRSPPHITLHMPFEWKHKREQELIECLTSYATDQPSFDISLNGFGAFAPRVIFAALTPNPELQEFRSTLLQCTKSQLGLLHPDYKGRGYHPHATIAFRDLKKVAFEEAWSEFQDNPYQSSFPVMEFALLKHNGKVWEIKSTFPFKHSESNDGN